MIKTNQVIIMLIQKKMVKIMTHAMMFDQSKLSKYSIILEV